LGGLFQLGQWEILNLYFGVKAFLKTKVYFFVGGKTPKYFEIYLKHKGHSFVNFKVGCFYKIFGIKKFNLGAN